MKPILSTFLALSCISFGCATHNLGDDYRRDLQTKLSHVVVEDGISDSEANIIAENYFIRFTPTLCGAVEPVSDGGAYWIANTDLGFIPTPTREPIRINKQTGRITWSDGPTIENPKALWFFSGGQRPQLLLLKVPKIGSLLTNLPESRVRAFANSGEVVPSFTANIDGIDYIIAVNHNSRSVINNTSTVIYLSTDSQEFKTPEGF